jgi:drug/metabolite transporter (DMT)-like permease
MTVVLGRVGIAALALLALAAALGARLPRARAAWGAFLVQSLLQNILPFGLIVTAQQWIDSGLAAILIGTSPLMSAVLSRLLGHEALGPARIAGLAVGLAGLVVLIGPSALAGLGRGTQGQLLVLLAAFVYAWAAIYGRRFGTSPPLVTATGQLVCAALVALPLALALDRPWTQAPSAEAWGALAAVALIATAAAFVVYFRILASAGATNTMLVTLLVPVGAVLLGALLLEEAITWRRLGGMALIAGGLALIDGRVLRRAAG